MNTFERLESVVRGYCRAFPVVFDKAEGEHMYTEDGTEYLDFFSGAGALSYGHNNKHMRDALVNYITDGRITHALDMYTVAKREWLETFDEVILKPRGMEYKIQFCGPTGTNAVEAAMKLARKVTGRHDIVCFTNGYHGMTLGSLSITGNEMKRHGAGVPVHYTKTLPFEGYGDGSYDALTMFEDMLADSSSGMDKPAAIILEPIQAEGGVNVASQEWLERLNTLCKKHDILIIADDIQVGCGRTGPFFSFENYDFKPDIITLSKSLSGYGMPLAVTLLRPDLDKWAPGEHNGTFRGFNPGFVTSTAMLNAYWRNTELTDKVNKQADHLRSRLEKMASKHRNDIIEVRGRGFIQGVEFKHHERADEVSAECFEHGLVVETSGSNDEVLKLLVPLIISDENLERGLDIIEKAIDTVVAKHGGDSAAA